MIERAKDSLLTYAFLQGERAPRVRERGGGQGICSVGRDVGASRKARHRCDVPSAEWRHLRIREGIRVRTEGMSLQRTVNIPDESCLIGYVNRNSGRHGRSQRRAGSTRYNTTTQQDHTTSYRRYRALSVSVR